MIGSLFGQSRVVEPEIPVDHEKLQAALEDAAGGAGTVKEGSITFESGKAVPVYPQAGKGVDVSQAADVVAAAYRTQVETGTAAAVNVPTTTQQPKVTKAEVDRMMKEFAEPAMSDPVTVQTDPAHSVLMSPEKSLWKFLRVEAVNGKLVEKPDLKALENLYGKAFEGVLITRGNGEKTPSLRRTSTAPCARRWSARATARPSSRRTRADTGRARPAVRQRRRTDLRAAPLPGEDIRHAGLTTADTAGRPPRPARWPHDNDDTVVFDRVTKKYGDVRAVDEVSPTLRPGETVALLGPNGAGKSTTLDLLLGLKRPDSGTVTLLGTSPREAVVAGRVGAMLQSGGLMGEVTVAGDSRPVSAARRQLSRARAARASPDAVRRLRVDRRDDLRVRLQFRRTGRELAALHEELGAFVAQAGRVGGRSRARSRAHRPTSVRSGRVAAQARTLFRMRATTSSVPAGASIDGSSGPPVAPATSSSASGPVSTRPPSNGSASTCPAPGPSGSPKPTTKCPGSATPYTGAPARRATSIHTADSRIGSPRRRRSTACSREDSSRR